MDLMAESDLTDLVIEWVRNYSKNARSEERAITTETDLIGTGLLDSYGMIDLLLFVETHVGCKIDLTDVDPTEFSVVGGVCRIALRSQQAEPLHVSSS
jgi:acyl carrier protein